MKNTTTQTKLKPKIFVKLADTLAENAMILTSAKILGKILFGEVGTLESSFWYWNVYEY